MVVLASPYNDHELHTLCYSVTFFNCSQEREYNKAPLRRGKNSFASIRQVRKKEVREKKRREERSREAN
jgi:hypothetical protein